MLIFVFVIKGEDSASPIPWVGVVVCGGSPLCSRGKAVFSDYATVVLGVLPLDPGRISCGHGFTRADASVFIL